MENNTSLASDIRTMGAAAVLAVVIVASSWVSGWVAIQHTNTRINDLQIPPGAFENRVDINQADIAKMLAAITRIDERITHIETDIEAALAKKGQP